MIISALILGLISSLHCVGMCGPIAIMLPVDRTNSTKKTLQIILYHVGRITSYGSLGLIFGLLGRSLYLAGIQQKLSIVLGIIIISVAVIPERVFAKYNFSKPIYRFLSHIRSALGKRLKKQSNFSIFSIGILNGFLPCAMIYVALFSALSFQNPIYGMFFMIFYGLGTIPLMSLMIYFSKSIIKTFGNKFRQIITFTIIIFGFILILRGLGLDIPFLSPSKLSLFVSNNPNC